MSIVVLLFACRNKSWVCLMDAPDECSNVANDRLNECQPIFLVIPARLAAGFNNFCRIQSGEYGCVGSYASAGAALYEVPRIRPEIVLIEISLPGMSGIECTRRLKVLLPGLIVVLVSGLCDPDTLAEALAAGDGLLTKPFTIAECLARLAFAMRSE